MNVLLACDNSDAEKCNKRCEAMFFSSQTATLFQEMVNNCLQCFWRFFSVNDFTKAFSACNLILKINFSIQLK